MYRRTPRFNRTDPPFPYTTSFRSHDRPHQIGQQSGEHGIGEAPARVEGAVRVRHAELLGHDERLHGRQDMAELRKPPETAERARRSRHQPESLAPEDRKSTRLNPVTNAQLVCRLLLEKKKKK